MNNVDGLPSDPADPACQEINSPYPIVVGRGSVAIRDCIAIATETDLFEALDVDGRSTW